MIVSVSSKLKPASPAADHMDMGDTLMNNHLYSDALFAYDQAIGKSSIGCYYSCLVSLSAETRHLVYA